MEMGMKKIITISWDSCELNPKCKGCYVEKLKSRKPIKEKTDLPEFIYAIFGETINEKYNISDININVSNMEDWQRIREILNATTNPGKTRVRAIFPPYLATAKNMKDIPDYVIKCVSINTWYFPTVALISSDIISNMNHIDKVEVELSFNPETTNDKEKIQSLTDGINKAKNKIKQVLINYVNTGGLETKSVLAKMYTIKSLLEPEIDGIISPCVEAGVGFNTKPCLVYDSYDYIDGDLMAHGCPFEGTESCL
jgi:hypothetical protein